MDENTKVSPEEQTAEQEALQEAKEEEIRAKVIEEFGFDPETDTEKIEKAVAKDMKYRADMSTAIRQKINWRTKATTKPSEPPKREEPALDPAEIDKRVDAKLEQRELDSLDYPDELKAEIQKVAHAQGISIRKAVADPYIAFKIDEHKKAVAADEASVSRTSRTSTKKTYSLDNPPDVDMTTAEGQKEWEAWKAEMKKQGH